MSNPTRADKTITMSDVWDDFVKPEAYEKKSEEWDYLETGVLPICIPQDDWIELTDDGATEYELWYSIGGINARFRKETLSVQTDGRCHVFNPIADDTPYIFFVYKPS